MGRAAGRWTSARLVAGLAAAACLALPAWALGGTGDVEYIEDSAPVVGPGSAVIDLDCVEGKVSGGGFSSSLGRATWSFPLTDWRTQIFLPASGQVTGFAICKSGKLRYPEAAASVGAGRAKSLKVGCPGDKHVVGGGGRIVTTPGKGWLNSSYPFDDGDRGRKPDDGWKIRVYNGDTDREDIQANAICQRSEPRYEQDKTTIEPDATGGALAVCGETAPPVLGAGVRMSGPADTGIPYAVRPDDDSSEPGEIPDDQVFAAGFNLPAAGGPKTLTGYAICSR